MKARKKPVLVDVWELPKTYKQEFIKTLPKKIRGDVAAIAPRTYQISSLEGLMTAHAGDYLVYGGNNDVWAVKKEIFEKTYEIVGG